MKEKMGGHFYWPWIWYEWNNDISQERLRLLLYH